MRSAARGASRAPIRKGIARATETLRNVCGSWIEEQQVEIDAGRITRYRVNMLITFVLEE